ncbi:hypothetical protein [Thalassoroseus pseudoceratinae]|uniref:hypothetical protein n=1 Tax=Thalassoroseus pseudoceratinae TaxID=2713176 RepID=UPI0014211FA5|nr:hypothetical protein [Thalassoroseus pseudoceratinae]
MRRQLLKWTLSAFCLAPIPVMADDSELAKPPAKATPPRLLKQKPLDEKLLDPEQLEETTDEEKPAPTLENPIETAVAGMRSASKRLQESQTDEETRQIQEKVISDLQKLIDLAEQSQNQKPKSPPPSQPPPQDQDQSNDKKSDQSPQQNEANQQPQPQSGESETSQRPQANDRSKESSEDANQTAAGGGASPPDRQHLMRDVWGHLPPAVRKKLLNMTGDKYLPKYEDLRKSYFESLAEQGRDAGE